MLRAIALVLAERPRLNRFTAGGRVWQRDGIWLSFSAKLRFKTRRTVRARVTVAFYRVVTVDRLVRGCS